ncbi:MAG: ATP synthase F1 subunit delta [Saprospiraceae bacterium]
MSVTRIATRYAKSLLELAIEQKSVEPVYADMDTLRSAVKHRELYMLLKSPIVHSDKKKAVLHALLEGKVSTLTLAYLDLLVNKGREMYIPEISAELVRQYKVLKRITSVRVISAIPLTDTVLDGLRKKLLDNGLTTENLEIETRVTPDLIGGFVLEFDNKRYDASVANKLAELKSEFMKNQYIKEI